MKIAKVKSSAKEQIVTMPKEAEFHANVAAVKVIVAGNERILRPSNRTWDDFFQSAATYDFCNARSSQYQSEREQF